VLASEEACGQVSTTCYGGTVEKIDMGRRLKAPYNGTYGAVDAFKVQLLRNLKVSLVSRLGDQLLLAIVGDIAVRIRNINYDTIVRGVKEYHYES
jgi:hypothetical protein